MNSVKLISGLVALAVVLACSGGEGSRGNGTVAGNVTDLSGEAVRGALIFANNDRSTTTETNSTGAYLLTKVKEGNSRVSAEIRIGGVLYYGENVIAVFANEPSKSCNIVMSRADQQASLTGVVRNRSGEPVEGARVFANSGELSSLMAVTDRDGRFTIRAIHPGRGYTIQASALGFDSDLDSATFGVREARRQDYVLANARDIGFNPPDDLAAVAWTSPREVTRSPKAAQTYESIKQMLDPRRAARAAKTRKPLVTALGNWIEVDLYWSPIENASLLGYGIYRGRNAQGATEGIEFLRDPLTGFFADQDPTIREGLTYFYEITCLNVRYPETNNSESGFSNRFGVRPLGDLTLRTVDQTGNQIRFRWNAALGAENYTVYVYDRYPDFGVAPMWPQSQAEIANATTTGTELVYSGPPLQSTGSYYYLVVGRDTRDGNDALTVSPVASFNPN